MKNSRQNAIRTLLKEQRIQTQEELAEALRGLGFRVTQATVSRDIKEMHLVKAADEEGGYRYAEPDTGWNGANERLIRLQELDLSTINVNMFTAYNNQLINDGCGLFRGRQILPFEHLSRFQNDMID